MSKQVRWIVPFQSLKGINYEIHIYDEGWVGNAVTLLASDVPFETSEDQSDDYFAAVRTSTGTIGVIDHDGSLMEQIVPANNVSRPVRLIRKGATAAQDYIEWQGFLSTEAYSQEYTGVAKCLTLNCISVLEAMDSVEIDPALASLKTIRAVIVEVLTKMSTYTPTNLTYYSIFFSYEAKDILTKYIDTTILFDKNEIVNENHLRYEITGISCLEMLRRLTTFMGMVLREKGMDLYFQRIGETVGMNEYLYNYFIGDGQPARLVTPSNLNISALTYRGTNHSKTILQGAKSVSVHANVESYDADLDLPKLDYTSLSHYHSGYLDAEVYVDDNEFDNISMLTRQYSVEVAKYIQVPGSASEYGPSSQNLQTTTATDVIEHSIVNLGANAPSRAADNVTTYVRLYTGAMMCNAKFSDDDDYQEGLYCLLLPNTIGTASNPSRVNITNPIVELKDILLTCYSGGCLKFNTDAKLIYNSNNFPTIVDSGFICISIKFGSQYWMGNQWGGFTMLRIEIENGSFKGNWSQSLGVAETDGYLVPVIPNATDHIEIQIWSMASDAISQPMTNIYGIAEMFITSLTCEYVPLIQPNDDGRGENLYYRDLLGRYKDTAEISTEMATYCHNKISPSIVRTDANGTPMMKMNYYTNSQGAYAVRRPEKDLLDRMAAYYLKPRRRLELVVEHPTTAELPLLSIDARNNASGQVNEGYDGRLYLPLSESRDWQTDTSTITCFESPDGDE